MTMEVEGKTGHVNIAAKLLGDWLKVRHVPGMTLIKSGAVCDKCQKGASVVHESIIVSLSLATATAEVLRMGQVDFDSGDKRASRYANAKELFAMSVPDGNDSAPQHYSSSSYTLWFT
ncbi:hypothetical protein LTR95_011999 [Oleoguttula sp. CCFEE 5521]